MSQTTTSADYATSASETEESSQGRSPVRATSSGHKSGKSVSVSSRKNPKKGGKKKKLQKKSGKRPRSDSESDVPARKKTKTKKKKTSSSLSSSSSSSAPPVVVPPLVEKKWTHEVCEDQTVLVKVWSATARKWKTCKKVGPRGKIVFQDCRPYGSTHNYQFGDVMFSLPFHVRPGKSSAPKELKNSDVIDGHTFDNYLVRRMIDVDGKVPDRDDPPVIHNLTEESADSGDETFIPGDSESSDGSESESSVGEDTSSESVPSPVKPKKKKKARATKPSKKKTRASRKAQEEKELAAVTSEMAENAADDEELDEQAATSKLIRAKYRVRVHIMSYITHARYQ